MAEIESLTPVRIRTSEYPMELREAHFQFESVFLRKALDRHNGNISQTALSLGVARRTLQMKIKRCGLNSVPKQKIAESSVYAPNATIE